MNKKKLILKGLLLVASLTAGGMFANFFGDKESFYLMAICFAATFYFTFPFFFKKFLKEDMERFENMKRKKR